MIKYICNATLFLWGYLFNNIQYILNIHSLDEGVNYYGEIHQSSLNKVIHGLCMPITTYGLILSVPVLLTLNNLEANIFRVWIYYFYLGLYYRINSFYATLFGIIYIYPVYLANKNYQYNLKTLLKGLSISFCSLFIQEYIGHYLGGDDPSRPEGVLNAILYASYFGPREIYLLSSNLLLGN